LPGFDDEISEETAKKITLFLENIQDHIKNNDTIKNKKIAENYSYWYIKNRNNLDESIQNNYKVIIDKIDSEDNIVKKINEIEKNINTREKRKEITKHIQEKNHDTTLYMNYDFELFPEIKELILQYCAECEKITSQSKDISNLEENIGKILHYVKENDKAECPTCLTPFESSNQLVQNIQQSIESVKLHLSTQKRDEIYENIMKHYFMTS
jgi:Asp-tRNA(Asn)/Glu-tRNA(Gln) amidotransferase C subunit